MRIVATLKDDADRDQHHWDIEVKKLGTARAVPIIEKALFALVETLRHEARWPDRDDGLESGLVPDELRYLSQPHFID